MLWWSVALASPPFPAALASLADLPCDPACTTCHATAAGGTGTVVTPFGTAMRDAGLVGGQPETLGPALADLADRDSDGDDLPDAAALAAGLDPSTGAELCGGPVPIWGCFSQTGRAPSLAGALAAVLLVGRRARRRLRL
jgi:cytochrome c peroxidase